MSSEELLLNLPGLIDVAPKSGVCIVLALLTACYLAVLYHKDCKESNYDGHTKTLAFMSFIICILCWGAGYFRAESQMTSRSEAELSRLSEQSPKLEELSKLRTKIQDLETYKTSAQGTILQLREQVSKDAQTIRKLNMKEAEKLEIIRELTEKNNAR